MIKGCPSTSLAHFVWQETLRCRNVNFSTEFCYVLLGTKETY